MGVWIFYTLFVVVGFLIEKVGALKKGAAP
jgi:hypothetical protein